MTVDSGFDASVADPLVSVIVPTRNSARTVARCLESLERQTYPNIEVIVVDNASSDSTREIAASAGATVVSCGGERAQQVNVGAQQATGKYLYYTGSDLTQDPELVAEAVRTLESTGFDAVYINVVTDLESPNGWEAARAVERLCYVGEPGMSASRFWRRDVFAAAGGLDERMGAISDDLAFQRTLDELGYKTTFIKPLENNVGEYSSLRTIVLRSLYYGWSVSTYFATHPGAARRQYKPVRGELWRHRRELLKDKRVFAYFLAYKTAQYAAGAVGLLLSRATGGDERMQRFLHRMNYGPSGAS